MSKKLPTGLGIYRMRMVPYLDRLYHYPFTSLNASVEVDQRLYVDVRAEGIDGSQIATVLDSCWATPVDDADYHVRWDLIAIE